MCLFTCLFGHAETGSAIVANIWSDLQTESRLTLEQFLLEWVSWGVSDGNMKDALRQGRLTPTGVRSMIYLIAEKIALSLKTQIPRGWSSIIFFYLTSYYGPRPPVRGLLRKWSLKGLYLVRKWSLVGPHFFSKVSVINWISYMSLM